MLDLDLTFRSRSRSSLLSTVASCVNKSIPQKSQMEWCNRYRKILDSKTDKRGEDSHICWPFKGRQKAGYGLVDVDIPGKGKTTRHAHRLVLMTRVAGSWDVSSELQASHLCGNRICVRPSHLVFESREENKDRQICQSIKICKTHDPSCIIAQ